MPPVGKTERVYLFVRDYIKQVGYAPSIRETSRNLKLGGYSTVYRHIKKLIDAGLLIGGDAKGVTCRTLTLAQ